jgi:uncharacterized linocin/CFP29 family protein
LAPITETGWSAVDGEACSVFQTNLSARRFVDLVGPKGWDFSAVNLGRLDELRTDGDVHWGLRQVSPLVEIRVPFVVSRWALDDLHRGADNVDLGTVRAAALAFARFEDRVVYQGLADAHIEGLIAASEHDAVPLGLANDATAEAIATAVIRLKDAGVDGPYALVLGDELYRRIAGDQDGYPLRQQLSKLVGSEPAYSPGLEGGLLISMRGGDFELTLGADVSIGFDHTEGDDVHLYITESFTFRVTGSEAVVVLR